MKKLLLLLLFVAGFAGTGSAQVTFSFDSIWVPPYICQASHFDVEVFGMVADGSTQYGTQSFSVSNDTIYAKFHFVSGTGPAIPYPLYRKINIPAPLTFGQYKIVAQGIYNGQIQQTITSRISICAGMLDVPEPEAAFMLNVFPNPATDEIRITFAQYNNTPFAAVISDVTGKTWLHRNFIAGEKQLLNIKTLPKGIYLLQLQTETGSPIKRIVKQ